MALLCFFFLNTNLLRHTCMQIHSLIWSQLNFCKYSIHIHKNTMAHMITKHICTLATTRNMAWWPLSATSRSQSLHPKVFSFSFLFLSKEVHAAVALKNPQKQKEIKKKETKEKKKLEARDEPPLAFMMFCFFSYQRKGWEQSKMETNESTYIRSDWKKIKKRKRSKI